MRLHLSKYEDGKTYEIEENVNFSSLKYPSNARIKSIESCLVKGKLSRYDDLIKLDIYIQGNAVVKCSYTNEEFIFPYKCKENLIFTSDPNGEDYYYERNEIDLDEYLISFIDSLIPLNPIKKGAKRPENGSSYRVLSEDELIEERKKRKDPRWAALDDIEL